MCTLRQTEKSQLLNLFIANGYPKCYINFCTRVDKKLEEKNNINDIISLPYMRGTSEATERLLEPLDIRVALKPIGTLSFALFNDKDHVNHYEQSRVVYDISCMGCDKEYIDKTSKLMRTRLSEHKLALKRADPRSQV